MPFKKGGLKLASEQRTPIQIAWMPQEDITAYEMARALTIIVHAMRRPLCREELPVDSPEVLRHFEISALKATPDAAVQHDE